MITKKMIIAAAKELKEAYNGRILSVEVLDLEVLSPLEENGIRTVLKLSPKYVYNDYLLSFWKGRLYALDCFICIERGKLYAKFDRTEKKKSVGF